MLQPLLLSLTPLLAAPPALVVPLFEDHAAEIKAAGRDVDKLLALADAWIAADEEDAARDAWTRVLVVDQDNARAHTGLRHHQYDGVWYETYAALSSHRREEARAMRAKGLVRLGADWVPIGDAPFMKMGWERLDDGQWAYPGSAKTLAANAKLAADGWQLQDATWIHPDEFDKWRAGQWKIGDAWVTKDEANAHHANIDQPWEIPGEKFTALTTCDRDSAQWVAWWADQAYGDLVRVFGQEPAGKPEFLIVKDIAQYNIVAGGDPANGRPPTEASGHSSVHYAFFAEAYFDTTVQPVRFRGMGVSYWDRSDPSLDPYGQHAARHAAAQSFIEAIDPSWNAVSDVVAGNGFALGAFWGEKRIPQWLRYGAASYAERFFRDANVADGGNPWWAREWAIANLGGELIDTETVLAFQLDNTDIEGSGRLIHNAGLLVSYMLDGEDKKVAQAHADFVTALAGTDAEMVAEAAADLEKALESASKKIAKYAGI